MGILRFLILVWLLVGVASPLTGQSNPVRGAAFWQIEGDQTIHMGPMHGNVRLTDAEISTASGQFYFPAGSAGSVVLDQPQAAFPVYTISPEGTTKRNVVAASRVIYRDIYPGVSATVSVEGGQLRIQMQAKEPGRLAAARLCERGGECLTAKATPGRFGVPTFTDFILDFSLVIGGSGVDNGLSIVGDSSGNIVMGGVSEGGTFATSGSVGSAAQGGNDGFLLKLNGTTGAILWATFFGGTGNDAIESIAVAGDNSIYAVGSTTSSTLPGSAGILQGSQDAFITRINGSGSAVLFTRLIGGAGNEKATVVKPTGSEVVVGGWTNSTDFPTTTSLQMTSGGGQDGFLYVVSDAGSRLAASYLGGNGQDAVTSLDLYGSSILVGGSTFSTNFVQSRQLQTGPAGGEDGFLALISRSLVDRYFSSYIGSTSGTTTQPERVTAISVIGNFGYIAGITSHRTAGFLSTSPRTSGGGTYDAFALRFHIPTATLQGTTYLGGNGQDYPSAILANSLGQVYVAGYTTSNNLPSVGVVGSGAFEGGYDGWITALSTDLQTMSLQATFGGTQNDVILGAAFSGFDELILAGFTNSPNFTTTTGVAIDSAFGSAFVMRLSSPSKPISATPNPNLGATSLITIVAEDPQGFADIQTVRFMVHNQISPTNSCYGYVSRPDRQFGLASNSGGTFTTLGLGAGGSLSNSQCSLPGADARVVEAGTRLSFIFRVNFTAGFSGLRNIYVQTIDRAGRTSSWAQLGAISANSTNQPPASMTGTATSLTGTEYRFQINVSDPNGFQDVSQLYFLIHNVIAPTNACYFVVQPQLNQLTLLSDDATAGSTANLGSNQSLANSQCSIDMKKAASSGTGEVYQLNLTIQFSTAFTGQRSIYGLAFDNAQQQLGFLNLAAVPVFATTDPPSIRLVSPTSGTGQIASFLVDYNDAKGWPNLKQAVLVINSNLNGANACYFVISPVENTVYLADNSTASWTGAPFGSSIVLSNSQCDLAAADVQVSGTGNDGRLRFVVAFKPGFTSLKRVYMYLENKQGLSTAYSEIATWTPAQPAPTTPVSVLPASGSGLSSNFTFEFSDAQGAEDVFNGIVLFGSTLNSLNNCYFFVNSPGNFGALASNTGSSWSSATIGALGGTLSNSQCTVNVTAMTVTRTGNTFRIAVPITFNTAWKGTKTVFLLGVDKSGLNSGWQPISTWTVP